MEWASRDFRCLPIEISIRLNVMATLTEVVNFLEGTLAEVEIEDYPGAFNGLQVEMNGPVARIASAVDASESSLEAAASAPGTLLLVHHGLFWGGMQRLTGSWMRKMRMLIEGKVAVYSSHLPLDAHPVLGNNVLLARAMGFSEWDRFLPFNGVPLGVKVATKMTLSDLTKSLADAVGRPPRVTGRGPQEIRSVGIVTGGAGSETGNASAAGVDAFITGEAPHHACVLAEEIGVHLLLGGHYETETFGVRALGEKCAGQFSLPFKWIGTPPFELE